MPSQVVPAGPAKREDSTRPNSRHPMLKAGSTHFAVWTTIVRDGNPKGGITAAQLKGACDLYHPQVLADLQKARLVAKNGRLGRSFKYIGDDKGVGIVPQQLDIEVELYEDANGNFLTRTYLRGRQDDAGAPVRFLGSRKIKMDVPGRFASGVKEVLGEVQTDADYDPYEVHRAKKNKVDANVVIEAEPVGDRMRDTEARARQLLTYDPEKEDGCIIDQ